MAGLIKMSDLAWTIPPLVPLADIVFIPIGLGRADPFGNGWRYSHGMSDTAQHVTRTCCMGSIHFNLKSQDAGRYVRIEEEHRDRVNPKV